MDIGEKNYPLEANKIEWGKVTPSEAVEIIGNIITTGTNVLRERVLFLDDKMVENEKGETLMFVAKLKEIRPEKMELSWVQSLMNPDRVGLEYTGEINIGIQEITENKKAVLIATKTKDENGIEMREVRRFSPLKR